MCVCVCERVKMKEGERGREGEKERESDRWDLGKVLIYSISMDVNSCFSASLSDS